MCKAKVVQQSLHKILHSFFKDFYFRQLGFTPLGWKTVLENGIAAHILRGPRGSVVD
jgi:hypothetical protein